MQENTASLLQIYQGMQYIFTNERPIISKSAITKLFKTLAAYFIISDPIHRRGAEE
jgi:hypothetical protein